MIELKNISKTFNKNEPTEVSALNNISLEIKAKEFVVLVGANGSGKSSLLNLISGGFITDSGTVIINNTDVTSLPDYKRTKWISRVFQNPLIGTAPDLSILDNFRLAALRTKSKNITLGINDLFIQKVKDYLLILEMGLEHKINQPVGSLSGGQRQAITLLMSVMDETKILLLDEPTAALDPKSADIVMRTAQNLIEKLNLTTILVTHNLKEAVKFGNRIIQMNNGKIERDLNASEKANLNTNNIFSWFQ